MWNSAARIHGMPFTAANKVSSMMPDLNCPRLEVLLDENAGIKKLYQNDPEFKVVYDDAINLQDCIASIGVHACYAADTLVTTSNGYKNIQDVVVGDKVLTISGLYEDVVNTIVTENKDTLKVSGSSFLSFEATADHPIYVATKNSETNSYEYGFKNIENIDISKDMLVYSINNNSTMPDIDFKNINYTSESFWELLGLFVADGWTENPRRNDHRVILCSEKNEEEKKYISNLFLESGITFRLEEVRTTYKYNFHIKGNNIYDIALMFGRGAKNKEIPGFVFDLPKNYIKAFIKGYLYGDGSSEDWGYSYRTVSTKLAIGITSLVAKAYGKVGTINKNIRSNTSIIEGRTVNQSDIYSCYIRNNTRSYIIDGENILCKINSIEEGSKNISVYNLTVANNSTFVANNIITHNCGAIIADEPLYNYIPLWDSKGQPVSQYEGAQVEEEGLVKLDILGLKTLSVLNTARRLILERTGEDIDYYTMPVDDAEAYKIMWEGQNVGIFQFEGAGISGFVNACKPRTIHDVAVITSVYRPKGLGH